MHQVNLKLAGPDLVNPSVGLHAQGAQCGSKFIPKRGQLVEHIQAERALPDFGATAPQGRWLQGVCRVAVGGRQVELNLGRDHWGEALRGVARQHRFQQTARREHTQRPVHLHAVVNR